MLLDEFEKLTGFYPTERHYSAIEVAYMEFDGDKLEFCRKYKENEDGLAEKIRLETDMAAVSEAKAAEKRLADKDSRIKELEGQVKKLNAQIRKMEGWAPYRVSEMSTIDYKELLDCVKEGYRRFGDGTDVYAWINDEFGFEQDKLQIVDKIPRYEKSKDGRIRKTGEYEERKPAYYSTDWNYVRFDAGPYQYEIVNGELYMYRD